MTTLRQDADRIVQEAIVAAQPRQAVARALQGLPLAQHRRLVLVAIGKAAFAMAQAAQQALGPRLHGGVVITKYGHAAGDLPGLAVYEAAHPVPDEAGLRATQAAMDCVKGLDKQDAVLFLVSGGGSALFEHSVIPLEELMSITRQLLASGADIVEINTVRKRLSHVKGGRFAQLCAPAQVYAIILSDIIGDPLDMIASGPAYADASTCAQAEEIVRRYGISLSEAAQQALQTETPKALGNVQSIVTGSVRQLCAAAEGTCRALGYAPHILSASLRCQAREAGSFLASVAEYWQDSPTSQAFIAGGETVVQLKGQGKGGRNQELALAAVPVLGALRDTAIFSVGSDGTDGPTDAAGGYADQNTLGAMQKAGVDPAAALENNDAYHALAAVDGLIITGPTGTNVNDLCVVLIRR